MKLWSSEGQLKFCQLEKLDLSFHSQTWDKLVGYVTRSIFWVGFRTSCVVPSLNLASYLLPTITVECAIKPPSGATAKRGTGHQSYCML